LHDTICDKLSRRSHASCFLPASSGILSPRHGFCFVILAWSQAVVAGAKTQSEAKDFSKGNAMNLILLIVLIVLLLGAAPTWPYSRNWGYYPSGGLGMVVVILLILMLMGRL
jgi:hypothetical protein